MNNKGQALVAFILLLPIIFLLIAFIFELGFLGITKQKYESEVKDAIKYGLKHIDDSDIKEKMESLLAQNIDGDINVEITDNKIVVSVHSLQKTTFENLIKKNNDINIRYVGYKETGKIKEE